MLRARTGKCCLYRSIIEIVDVFRISKIVLRAGHF